MKITLLYPTSLALAALLAGCAQDARTPVSPSDAGLSSAKGNTDTYPRAHLVWADQVMVNGEWVPAGIQGDDRDKKGQPNGVTDEYQGQFCGVGAKIWSGTRDSGDLVFDSDATYTSDMDASCGGGRRYLKVDLRGLPNAEAGIYHAGSKTVMREVWKLSVDQFHERFMGFGHDMPSTCVKLMFDAQYTGVRNVLITRLPDTSSGARQWRVQSQGTHEAACVVSGKAGAWVDTGVRIFAPFSVTATEVPYPSWTVYP